MKLSEKESLKLVQQLCPLQIRDKEYEENVTRLFNLPGFTEKENHLSLLEEETTDPKKNYIPICCPKCGEDTWYGFEPERLSYIPLNTYPTICRSCKHTFFAIDEIGHKCHNREISFTWAEKSQIDSMRFLHMAQQQAETKNNKQKSRQHKARHTNMPPSARADLRDTIIASIVGYLIGLIINMPPGIALLFMGCTPTTLKHILGEYHWKDHHILTNIAAFIFCNAINMICAYGMLISLALLVICLLLIPFGIDLDTSVYHLFR